MTQSSELSAMREFMKAEPISIPLTLQKKLELFGDFLLAMEAQINTQESSFAFTNQDLQNIPAMQGGHGVIAQFLRLSPVARQEQWNRWSEEYNARVRHREFHQEQVAIRRLLKDRFGPDIIGHGENNIPKMFLAAEQWGIKQQLAQVEDQAEINRLTVELKKAEILHFRLLVWVDFQQRKTPEQKLARMNEIEKLSTQVFQNSLEKLIIPDALLAQFEQSSLAELHLNNAVDRKKIQSILAEALPQFREEKNNESIRTIEKILSFIRLLDQFDFMGIDFVNEYKRNFAIFIRFDRQRLESDEILDEEATRIWNEYKAQLIDEVLTSKRAGIEYQVNQAFRVLDPTEALGIIADVKEHNLRRMAKIAPREIEDLTRFEKKNKRAIVEQALKKMKQDISVAFSKVKTYQELVQFAQVAMKANSMEEIIKMLGKKISIEEGFDSVWQSLPAEIRMEYNAEMKQFMQDTILPRYRSEKARMDTVNRS